MNIKNVLLEKDMSRSLWRLWSFEIDELIVDEYVKFKIFNDENEWCDIIFDLIENDKLLLDWKNKNVAKRTNYFCSDVTCPLKNIFSILWMKIGSCRLLKI